MNVGWDWAAQSHHVTVIDESGAVVDAFAVEHCEEGLSEGLERLRGLETAGKLPVAIERPEGLVQIALGRQAAFLARRLGDPVLAPAVDLLEQASAGRISSGPRPSSDG